MNVVLVPLPLPALILVRNGKRWWRCPNCAATLAELVGDRIVVVRSSFHWSAPIVPGMTQTCHHCHTASVYPHP